MAGRAVERSGDARLAAIERALPCCRCVRSAHQLRHRAATEALRKCHDLRKVQTLLGHASVGTTAIYTKIDASDLADIIVDVNAPPRHGVDGYEQLELPVA